MLAANGRSMPSDKIGVGLLTETRPFALRTEAATANDPEEAELPEAPHMSGVPLVETNSPGEWMIVHNTPGRAVADKPNRIFDWQFMAVHGVYGAAVAFDDYVTIRGLGPTCPFVEGNPDLGPNPSAKSVAIHGAVEFASVVVGDALLKWYGRRTDAPQWVQHMLGSVAAAIGTGKHLHGGYLWTQTGCL